MEGRRADPVVRALFFAAAVLAVAAQVGCSSATVALCAFWSKCHDQVDHSAEKKAIEENHRGRAPRDPQEER